MSNNSTKSTEELLTIRARRKAQGKPVSDIDREHNRRKSTGRLDAEIASRQAQGKHTSLLEETRAERD